MLCDHKPCPLADALPLPVQHLRWKSREPGQGRPSPPARELNDPCLTRAKSPQTCSGAAPPHKPPQTTDAWRVVLPGCMYRGISYWFSCAEPVLSEQEPVPLKPSSAWDLSCFSRSRRRLSLAASSSSSTLHCAVSLAKTEGNPPQCHCEGLNILVITIESNSRSTSDPWWKGLVPGTDWCARLWDAQEETAWSLWAAALVWGTAKRCLRGAGLCQGTCC